MEGAAVELEPDSDADAFVSSAHDAVAARDKVNHADKCVRYSGIRPP